MRLKTAIRENSKKFCVFGTLAFLFFSFLIPSVQAAGESDPNSAYFSKNGYENIDGTTSSVDPQAGTFFFDISKAYKTLQTDSNAVVIQPGQNTYLINLLKDNQHNVKSKYYQLIADYTTYTSQLAAFKKNSATNEYYTNEHGTTTLKFETTGGFVDFALGTYKNIIDNPWTVLFDHGASAAGLSYFETDIKPRIDNAGNAVAYWRKMQDDRKSLDESLAHIHVLIYILHSKTPNASAGSGEYWRASADDLYSFDQSKGQYNPEDPDASNTIFKYEPGHLSLNADGPSRTYTKLSAFLKDYARYDVNGAIAKPVDEIGGLSATAESNNGQSLNNATRCGGHSIASFLNFLDLTYDICVVVDTVSQFSDTLLLSAAQLLATTAGLPGASKDLQIPVKTSYHPENSAYVVPQSNIWGTILPSDISTPFQTLMVDQGSSVGKTVASTASIVNKLLDVIVVLVFLASAIASILQIQTNTLGIRKLIPGLILGFILAQFSFFMIRASLEVVGQASTGILSLATADPNTDTGNVFQDYVNAISNVRGDGGSACFTDSNKADCGGTATNTHVNNGRVFQQAVLNLFVIGGAIILFILGFLFGARVFIFTLAVPLAPLAVLCRFIPPLNFVWTRWSKTVIAWIIMPLPVMLLFVLSAIYFKSASGLESKDGVGLFGYMIDYAAGMVFLLAAIKLPFSMAGEGKAFLDKYNAMGRGIGIRATPYGALLRGKSKIDALSSKSEKQLLEGSVIKNPIARKLGGETVNRAFSRADKRLDKASEEQKTLDMKVDAEAEKQLQVGMGKTAAQAIAARKGLEGLGKALEDFVDKGERLQKKTGIAALRKGSSYAATTEAIAQRKLDTDQISGQATFESERRFILGGDMSVADHRYTDLISKLKKTKSLELAEWLELKGLGKKNGANSELLENASDTTLTAAQQDANRDIFINDGHTQKISKQRAAVDRVAFTRREKIAETAGLKGAQENLRSEAEKQFARERVSENGKNSVIKSVIYSNTDLANVAKRTKAFDVMLLQSKKNTRLKKIMDENNITSQADLDIGNNVNDTKITAVRKHFADLQVENIATSMAEDGTNKGLEKNVAADIGTKQNDWKLGFAASNISKLFPEGGRPVADQEVLYGKLLSGDTSTLDPDKFSATDVGTAERNLGALSNGLQSEEFRIDNAKAIKDILLVGGIGLFAGTDGYEQLENFIQICQGKGTPSGNLRNDISRAKQELTDTKLGKRLNQITSAPEKYLAS